MNQVKIGKFISECRKEKGLTQQELAERLGLTAKAVSKWETGKGLPDVSLYEDICKELGVTLNEFFAGGHIEEQRLIVQTDENLEDILKEYYKMKKQKNIITIILCVIAGGGVLWLVNLIKNFILLGGFLVLFEFMVEPDVLTDPTKYNKNYYFETYCSDLDSTLSVFPDSVSDDMDVKVFHSSFKSNLFDTAGYIVLDYYLKEDEFEKEIERLQRLEAKIENYDGATHTNKVMYVEGEYDYPAYITIDGFRDTFEYALIDEENCRIVCVYLSYVNPQEFPYEEYLKEDISCYGEIGNYDEFTMYSYSFDGGDSYVEYNDYIP